ncbi:DNA damage-binding protein 2-like [Ornithodoros turicata]|uniref:DNA damage-binding protein 2-like n=1 Tax=Ornithodoros turicata TaxID=34597 RepID=UPI0031387E07
MGRRNAAKNKSDARKRREKSKLLSDNGLFDIENRQTKEKKPKKSKKQAVSEETSRYLPFRETNLLHYLDSFARGVCHCAKFRQRCVGMIGEEVSGWDLSPLRKGLVQQARITCLCWHPQKPHLLAVGSKAGEILLYNSASPDASVNTPPLGSGASIAAMKFHWENPGQMYSANLLGTVMLHHLDGHNPDVYWDTNSVEVWFTALDICPRRTMVLAGDNVGKVYAFSADGQRLWSIPRRLHKGKVKHVEFSLRDPNLLVTASVDHTVKLWDVRRLSCPTDALHTLHHHKGLNSAYFSPSDGCSLLVTDQHSELRVYRGPTWKDVTTIPHPHRQFQHLTAIQASWYPLEDVVVVGRYPEEKFLKNDVRGIDLYCGHTGKLLHKIKASLSVKGIFSLNSFNCTGDKLASCTGQGVVLFHPSKEG